MKTFYKVLEGYILVGGALLLASWGIDLVVATKEYVLGWIEKD